MANNNNAVPNPDYQPTTWEQGMIITAKDLNDMEEQIDELVEAVPEIIKVSDNTPNSPYNQVWIKKGEPITLAQMDDFNTFCDSFAPTYTKGNNYEVGDYVIYNTVLYKCKQKVTNAPEQLDQSAWSKVYLIDDITNLIKVQDTQPTSELNKLWLTSTPDQGVTLATYQDFVNMIAEEYSTTKLYKTGDYVIHDGQLYRRLNDASNPGNWTQSNWVEVIICDEIQAANEQVQAMNTQVQTVSGEMQAMSEQVQDTSEQVQTMSESLEECNSMMASIAAEYDSTKTYNVGDYCKYNSKIYRCNTSIGTAEAWTAEHWTEVIFSEELSNLKSAIDDGYKTFEYNQDLSLLTTSGSGRYIIGDSFPSGNVESISIYVAENSSVEIRLYTLDNGKLNVAFFATGSAADSGMLEIPIHKKALNPFFIMINRLSGGMYFRRNNDFKVYGVSVAESYDYPLENASNYEFGVNVKYSLSGNYSPLGKNYLLIGDSYLEGYTPDGSVVSWGERLKRFMGAEYNTVIKYRGGVGFIPYDFGQGEIGFESLAISADVPNPETITHVVVCGGYNDAVRSASQGESGILTRIQSFVTNVQTKYPNATIYVGMIGYRNNDENVLSRIRNAGLSAYRGCVRYGASERVKYLNNVEWVLTDNDMSSDGYHPSGDGQYRLGMAIKNAILSGTAPNNNDRILNTEFDNLKTAFDEGYNKNLFNIRILSATVNGITITDNKDGTFTLDGTASETVRREFGSVYLSAETEYILTGSENYSVAIQLLNEDNTSVIVQQQKTGSGTEKVFTVPATGKYNLRVYVGKGTSVSSELFKPMIRYAYITDGTFEPYGAKETAIWIGDSYVQANSLASAGLDQRKRFSTVVCRHMGWYEKNYAVGGMGFLTGTTTYITQLQNAIADESYNHLNVKHVFICGGRNDMGASALTTDLRQAVRDVLEMAKANFPNAEIVLVPMTYDNNNISQNGFYTYKTIINAGIEYEATFIENAYMWLIGMKGYILSDNVHPNEQGHALIASHIINALSGGDSFPYPASLSLTSVSSKINTSSDCYCCLLQTHGEICVNAVFTLTDSVARYETLFSATEDSLNSPTFIGKYGKYIPIVNMNTGATGVIIVETVQDTNSVTTFKAYTPLVAGFWKVLSAQIQFGVQEYSGSMT